MAHEVPTTPKDTATNNASGVKLNTLRVLYLFAGRKRKNDIQAHLIYYAKLRGLELVVKEVDLLIHGEDDNILDDKVWQTILKDLERGEYDAQILSPPCNEFSRAKWANNQGPQPTRSRQYQRGYPWLRGRQ